MPIRTLKNFVHLLRDSDNDYKDEIRLEHLRREIVEKMRSNKAVEAEVNKLELKLGLLIKNKITLDEIDRERRAAPIAFGSVHHRGTLDRNGRMNSANGETTDGADPFSLSSLDAATARKLEAYQELFYLLQTRPDYLGRVFGLIDQGQLGTGPRDVVERATLILFGYAQQEREEFLLVKLLQRCMADSVRSLRSLREFETGIPSWYKLAMNYVRGPKERAYLAATFRPVIDLVAQARRLDPNPVAVRGDGAGIES